MYTALNNRLVEASLQKQLDIIVRHVVDLYGPDCTIILAGGFGRGEGSVRITQNRTAIPLHDFDTYVITDNTLDGSSHANMERDILKELSDLAGTDLRSENFTLGVEVVPQRSLNRLPPDLSTFEMKAASTVLYGQDVRSRIPLNSEDIALGSAAITLFHRTTALLKNVEPEFLLNREYPMSKRLETVYECCKVYTEICTSLSLLAGFYKPSYQSRADEFRTHFSLFPELQQKLPDLPQKVKTRTGMKLASDFSPLIAKPAETWIDTRHSLDVVLRFFLSKFLGIDPTGPWRAICRESRPRMRWIFFQDYLRFYLARFGVHGSPLVNAANLLFQAYDFQAFKQKVRREGKYPTRSIFSVTSPILDVYMASVLVLFALQDDGTVDQPTLDSGQGYLNRISHPDTEESEARDAWKRARDRCVEGQRLYFVVKQQKRVA